MEKKLEFVFKIDLEFDIRLRLGPIPGGGYRGLVTIAGGKIEGPRLNGRAIPNSGGDWAHFRSDSVIDLDARYLLEASDGTLIYFRNTGYIHGSAEVLAPILTQRPDPSTYYFRVRPIIEAPEGPHSWLSRTLIIGYGERLPKGNTISYYMVL
jgi:Protein of unknown function (DUF3237)